jgi:hypothetical protein
MGQRKVQYTVAQRAENKRAKKAAKARKRAEKAAEKAAAAALKLAGQRTPAEEKKIANLKSEDRRQARAAINRIKRSEAKQKRAKAAQIERQSELFAKRASKAREWTVRLQFVRRTPQLFLVKLSDPNPRKIPEARVARKVRAEVANITGKAADGSLPGLTFGEAEHIHASLTRKFTGSARKRA